MEYRFGEYGAFTYASNFVNSEFSSDFPLVGSNVEKSSDFCGTFSRNVGCLEGHLHIGHNVPSGVGGQSFLDGKISRGGFGVFVVHAFRCTDPLCPECCLHWAKLQAARALRRFKAFESAFPLHQLRHVVISVPEYEIGLSFSDMKKRINVILGAVGVEGGLYMFHPKRYNRFKRCWYFSPHFHILGYVLNGWLDGGLVREIHDACGYVIKNLGFRKSVYGTLMYQLSHAGVPSGRTRAVNWFGELNTRKVVKVCPELLVDDKKPNCCPVCGNLMVPVVRRAGSPFLDFRKVEGLPILDLMEFWCKVEYKKRYKGFDSEE